MVLAEYKGWVGQEVHFNRDNEDGLRMIKKGIFSGVIHNIVQGAKGVLFEIRFGVLVRNQFSHFSREAFVAPPQETESPSDQPKSRS